MRTRRLIALLCGCAAAWAFGPGVRLHGQELELIGTIPGPAAVVEVHGDRAYLGDGRTLRIVDVAAPAAPAVVGSVTLPENIYGLEVAGNGGVRGDRLRRAGGGGRCGPGVGDAARDVSGRLARR